MCAVLHTAVASGRCYWGEGREQNWAIVSSCGLFSVKLIRNWNLPVILLPESIYWIQSLAIVFHAVISQSSCSFRGRKAGITHHAPFLHCALSQEYGNFIGLSCSSTDFTLSMFPRICCWQMCLYAGWSSSGWNSRNGRDRREKNRSESGRSESGRKEKDKLLQVRKQLNRTALNYSSVQL